MAQQGKSLKEERYDEALIISELERRYFLYVVGGEYEKMFYTFDETGGEDAQGKLFQRMTRIKLEVEVSQAERKRQSQRSFGDPDYKSMLDYMLKHRINAKIESDEFIHSCREVTTLKPIWQEFGNQTLFDDNVFTLLETYPWLKEKIDSALSNPPLANLLNLTPSEDITSKLQALGYPLFIWMLPRFCGDLIFDRLHPSLRDVFIRMRKSSRFVSGAIGTLAMTESIDRKNKWMIYMLGVINVLPTIMLINLINEEMLKLIAQQKKSLGNLPNPEAKQQVLDNYEFSGDDMRELLSLEEFIKPHLLESLELKHFDPSPYLLGYAEDDANISAMFFQARAYALYRQLFKTGRIHTHETAILLKKHRIDKAILHKLNDANFMSVESHILLHRKLLSS